MALTEPPDGGSAVRAAAQDGVRRAVAEGSGRAGQRWAGPLAAAAGVAAAACAPVAWPLLTGGASADPTALTAAFAQLGGVGGGLLAEVVIRAWDRLRRDRETGGGESQLRDALADELREALASSAGVRAEVAAVLRKMDAVQVALTATVRTDIEESGERIQDALTTGLRDLGLRFSEFGWLLADVDDQVAAIAEAQAELMAGNRAVQESQQRMMLRMTLLQMTLQRQEIRSAYAAGDSLGLVGSATRLSTEGEHAAALVAAGSPSNSECPYPGLSAFQPEDANRFFGRDELTADLVTRLAGLMSRSGPLMVIGPSGSGKSSLLRAGLLPAIAVGALPAAGSVSWPLELMTPGARPLLELATRIAVLAGIPAGALHADLRTDPSRISEAIGQGLLVHARRQAQLSGRTPVPGATLAEADDTHPSGLLRSPRLILIVDQFEEVFTECADERERRAFVRALRAAAALPYDGSELPRRAASRDVAALVIVGMRADFYARCAADPDLAAYLKADQILVGPMTSEGLRAAIEGPAAQTGLAVDDGLTEVLLADLGLQVLSATLPDSAPERAEGAGGAPAAATGSYQACLLPLLAYALQQTWQNREGRRLTVSGYQASGGINGAVARAAEEVYERLSSEGRQAARRLLLRLVNPGEDSADTRRRVPVAELTRTGGDADFPDSSQAATVREVLADLVQARLLTGDTSADDTNTVEITHEALLWAWPRLREWLGQDRAGRRTHRDVTNAARAWRQNNYEKSHLFTGTRLAVALDWAADHQDDLNSDERTFLATCQQRRSRATLLRRGAAVTLTVLILLVAGTVAYALHNRSRAAGERIQSIANHAAAEAAQLRDTNPSLAAQLELVANRLDTTPDSTSQLLRAASTPLADLLAGKAGPVASVAYSPDGHTLAVGTADSKVQLWNVANPAHATQIGQPLTGPANGVNSVAFSPASHILAAAGGDGKVWLWDVTDPARARPARQLPTDPNGGVESVAFSPDGHTLAAGTTDGTVRLWNVANGTEITQIGRDLTVGTDNPVSSLAFSPHTHILAAGTTNSGAVWLWQIHGLAGGSPIGQPLSVGADGIVDSVAFSPDGQTLAAGTGASTIWLWDVNDLAQITPFGQPLTGAAGNVTSLAFSKHDHILAAGTGNEAVWLWNVTNPGAVSPIGQPLTGAAGTVTSVAFSPDGPTLAAGSSNQTIQLWNLPPTTLTGPIGPISSVAFGPGGHTLAAGSGDTEVWLWKATSAGRVIPIGQAWTGTTDGVSSVALSPDSHTLAAGNYGGLVRLWNLPPTTVTGTIGPTRYLLNGPGGPIYALTFSPDRHILAAGTAYRGIQLWNVSAPAPTPDGVPLAAPGSSVVFSPHGSILITAGSGRVRLWNVANPVHPTPIGRPLNADNVNTVTDSPDGHVLAVGTANGTVQLWNVADPAHSTPIGHPLTGPADGVNSVAFSPDSHTLAAAGGDGTVWLWNVTDPAHATPIGEPLTGPSSFSVSSVAFSPDGRTLAAGSSDDTVRIWDLNVQDAVDRICATTSGNLTSQQWSRYLSQLPYNPPCPQS